MTRLILGSQSIRRKEIMSQYSIPFTQATPPFVEEAVPFTGDPKEYVTTLSRGKAESLSHAYPNAILLTADTVVYCKGNVFNKPRDLDEAITFLSTFSGHWQSIFTGVTIRSGKEEYFDVEETRILFNELSQEQIRAFLSSIHWHDKAGGYTIQGIGNLLVRKIEGCYNNVTGLPVNTVRKLLLNVGIDLWHYVK